jgi:adenine-specific DNA-methyltransferase
VTDLTPTDTVSDAAALSKLSREQLVELIQAQAESGIRIQFAGKTDARKIARKVRPRVLREFPALGAGAESERARNVLIEGDNLQAMATLFRDRGQVDLILADPPYNTGGDFRYNDKWDSDPNDPGIGVFVSKDDGARHTKWMRFMYPRLHMMKSMLKPNGVLAICIDHRELFHLGPMLDELFKPVNRLAIINWQKMAGVKNHDKGVSTATEYVLVYAKNEATAVTGKIERSEATASGYTNPDSDERGPWAPSDSTLMGASTHPGQVYAIQNPFTGRLHRPQGDRCWRNERSKMKAALEAWGMLYEDVQLDDGLRPALMFAGLRNPSKPTDKRDPAVQRARELALTRREQGQWPRFFWRSDRNRRQGEGELRYKTYASEVSEGVVPTTFWAGDDFTSLTIDAVSWQHEQSGTSEQGQRELNAVVGRGHGFETVKPLMLFEKVISIWCPTDGLVLDPFAGSATTGHAVLDLNARTGSTRRFALIEQGRPERGDSYARTLSADRLQRVVTGNWHDAPVEALGGGYRFCSLDKKVDATALLSMERDEMTDTVIASHFDATKRRGSGLCRYGPGEYRYLVARNTDDEGFFLVWGGAGENTDFDENVYEECAKEAEAAGLKPRYHVYGRLYLFQTSNVIFYQIPDRILRDFGLDLRGEPFSDE